MKQTIILLFLSLTACSDSYDQQFSRLENTVKNKRIGSSNDVWLVKNNAFGTQDKVALIFGFLDDLEFCREVAQLYVKKYPSDSYICIQAN